MDLHEAHTLAWDLMKQHGLTDWELGWSVSIKNFGVCFYNKKLIQLSKPLVKANSVERVKDTILHEIAHALVGYKVESHGKEWKDCFISIGGSGRARWSDGDTVRTDIIEKFTFNNVTYQKGDIVKFKWGEETRVGEFVGYKTRNRKYPVLVYMGNNKTFKAHPNDLINVVDN